MKRAKQKSPASGRERKQKNHFSPDGKWETMARPTGLVRYVPSGMYYGRLRYKGKLNGPKSLETDDYQLATERLPDLFQKWKTAMDRAEDDANKSKLEPTLWSEASAKFVEESINLEKINSIQSEALRNRITNAHKIVDYWPSIASVPTRNLTRAEALQFFAEAIAGEGRFVQRKRPPGCGRRQQWQFFGGPQNPETLKILLWTAQVIVDKAIELDESKGLGTFANPFKKIPLPEVPFELPPLPSEKQFQQILTHIRDRSHRSVTADDRFRAWAGVNFLSMSGLRKCELIGERKEKRKDPHPGLLCEDVKDKAKKPYFNVICEKKPKGEKWRKRRKVPFYGGRNGPMMDLVRKLRKRWYTGNPKAKVFNGVSYNTGFNAFIETACVALRFTVGGKLLLFTQHDVRHIFATRCVEAGVSWKALAEWLGHEDGGILAAKIYSSLRDEHSFEMAERLGKHTRGN